MKKSVEPETANEGEPSGSRLETRPAAGVAAFARVSFAREPGLVAVGVAGLVVALLCLIAVAVRGSFIPPEGKMLDAVTFSFGVGLFTLTVALLLPLAGYSQAARRRWRRAYYLFAVYGLALESIQSLRGLDPRFTEAGGPLDELAGVIFGVTAGLNTVLFLIPGASLLPDRRDARSTNSPARDPLRCRRGHALFRCWHPHERHVGSGGR